MLYALLAMQEPNLRQQPTHDSALESTPLRLELVDESQHSFDTL